MVKKTFLVLICFIGLIIFVSTLHGQGSKKTITLPNGEVVWDLNGEWDALYVSGAGVFRDMVKITQQGSYFVGIKIIGTPYVPKGEVSIMGELDKNGVKKVWVILQAIANDGLDCMGQISEDGKKIIIEGGVRIKATFTRK